MIFVISSLVIILLIIASIVLVSVIYEIKTVSNINAATGAAQATSKTKVAVDKFGVTEIYRTKPNGGREWYINMSSPLNDKSFSLSGGSEKTSNSSLANATSSNGQIIKQGDGSYQVYGVRKTGKYDFSARMNVNTSDTDTAQWWKNIEMTGYTKDWCGLSCWFKS